MSRAIPLLPLLPSWSERQVYLFLQSTIAVAERRPNVSHNSMPNSPSNITARFFLQTRYWRPSKGGIPIIFHGGKSTTKILVKLLYVQFETFVLFVSCVGIRE